MMSRPLTVGSAVPKIIPTATMNHKLKHEHEEYHRHQLYSSEFEANQFNSAQKKKRKAKTKRFVETRVAESSESSDTESDELTRRTNSRQSGRHTHCRSPSPLPLQTFHGERSKWRTFLFQFEQLANVYHWSSEEKLQRILPCIRDRAAEYLEIRPSVVQDYHTLVKELTQRYSDKAPARIMRRQLNLIQQGGNESIDDFSDRIYNLAVGGYPGFDDASVQGIAIDAFFHGCKNKFAALMVMGTKPQTLSQAIRRLKDAIQDQKFLGVQPVLSQVPHEPVPASSQQPQHHPDDLPKMVTEAVQKAIEIHHVHSTPFRQCFRCGMIGHFVRDCPCHSNVQRPIDDPWKTTICYRCGHSGHFARACKVSGPSHSWPSGAS